MAHKENNKDLENIALGIIAIPYYEGQLALMPDSFLVAILPAANLLPAYNSHPTIVGSFIYEEVMVPVIDLAKFGNPEDNSEKKQLVVVDSINEDSAVTRYAFIADNPVNRMTVTESMIEEVESYLKIDGCYSKVKINYQGKQQAAYVIDIDRVETMLFPLH